MTAFPWFAAQLRPQGAQLALDHLERQGIAAFLPRRPVERRAGTLFRPTLEALFPGYIFVSFDPEDPDARVIRSTRGISRLVGTARGPSSLPSGFVPALHARCDGNGLIISEQELPIAIEVRVIAGPFAGLVGRILSAAPGERVQVLLTLLSAERAVGLDRDTLARA